MPVLVQLRDLTPRLAGLDLAALPEDKRRQALARIIHAQVNDDLEALGAQTYQPGLLEALRDGQVFLVLDGLDEVPAGLRGGIRQVVSALLVEHPVQRILITCRVRSYSGEAVLPGFTTHTLAPFNEKQVGNFAQAWYQAQKELGRVDARQAEEKTGDLAQAALGADLGEISSNPMMLTTMAIIHQKEIGLPKERVKLYNLAVDVLLRRWQKHKAGENLALSAELNRFLNDEGRLRQVIETLAYAAHSAGESTQEAAGLSRGEILTLLEERSYLGSLELASEFLDYVDQRAGLLVGHGGEMDRPTSYGFPHRTFQEYLAGCHIIGLREAGRELFRRAAEGDDWSLAAQLGAEELVYNRRSQNALLDLSYTLNCDPTDAQHQRALLWSANMAAILGSEIIAQDASTPAGGKTYLEGLKPRLVRLLGGVLSPSERAEAGRDLALLGDPRPEAIGLKGMLFACVPGGSFLMGSNPQRDKSASPDETPQELIDLPAYWIACYPVTNAQFGVFTRAGGYEDERWWGEASQARLWQRGKIQRRIITSKGFENEWAEAPYDYGWPFNLPNHPVVGISWYEALAFCRYLADHARHMGWLPKKWAVSLPSEAEWEKAARGGIEIPVEPILTSLGHGFQTAADIHLMNNPLRERIGPWGTGFESNNTNSLEAGIRSTSAVGCFPSGASPYGVEELSGNVWEWTRSLWGDYPYPPEGKDRIKREKLDAPDDTLRVLRGGCFYNNSRNVRCAYRGWDDPIGRDDSLGFRVVVSPIDSGL